MLAGVAVTSRTRVLVVAAFGAAAVLIPFLVAAAPRDIPTFVGSWVAGAAAAIVLATRVGWLAGIGAMVASTALVTVVSGGGSLIVLAAVILAVLYSHGWVVAWTILRIARLRLPALRDGRTWAAVGFILLTIAAGVWLAGEFARNPP